MANNVQPQGQGAGPFRKTLRLTFRVVNGEPQLVRHERLDMMCPPSIGERPQVGSHGGYWMELRDKSGRVLFHRILHAPLGDSVEVHSPDGKIRREVGTPSERVFEVLVPDQDEASTAVLVGEGLQPAKAAGARALRAVEPAGGTRELARFEIPK